MRKYFVFIVLVLPIYAMAENVIFNPGFDMTPWDTGWTIETDTATSGSCTKTAVAQVMPDTGSSLPNCCYLKTYVRLGSSGWCYGEAYAKTEVYQIFNEIPNCLIKAQIKYLWYWYNPCWFDDSVAIDARINGIWQTVWGKRWEDSTIWSEVSIGVNNPITGIRFRTKSWMYCGSLSGGASVAYRFWIDDICISEIGIEEKESRVKSSEFRVQQNPFARFTEIRGQKSEDRIEIYDMTGRLVEKTKESIIGENLHPGFYFVKAKGYKPVKVIKLGGVK